MKFSASFYSEMVQKKLYCIFILLSSSALPLTLSSVYPIYVIIAEEVAEEAEVKTLFLAKYVVKWSFSCLKMDVCMFDAY